MVASCDFMLILLVVLLDQRMAFYELDTIQHLWWTFPMLRVKSVIAKPNQYSSPLLVADTSWIVPNTAEPYDYILKTHLLWSLIHETELSNNWGCFSEKSNTYCCWTEELEKEFSPIWFIRHILSLKRDLKIKLRNPLEAIYYDRWDKILFIIGVSDEFSYPFWSKLITMSHFSFWIFQYADGSSHIQIILITEKWPSIKHLFWSPVFHS